MPTSLSQARGLSGSRVSMLTATTSKSAPPSLACNSSSAGISLRQGTHQVAHRLNSTVRPLPVGQPPLGAAAVAEGQVGQPERPASPRHRGDLAARERRDPLGGLDGRPAGRIDGRLPSNGLIPYTPASPTATPAMPPARISESRRLAGLCAASLVIVG